MNQNIKVAVIGGTGKAGRYLLKQLVSQNYSIRALTRNRHNLEETKHVEKVIGDVTDYESVYNLVDGCDALISTLGQTKGENPGFSLADCKGSGISSTDLAKFLISQIEDKRFLRKAPFIWNC